MGGVTECSQIVRGEGLKIRGIRNVVIKYYTKDKELFFWNKVKTRVFPNREVTNIKKSFRKLKTFI